MKSKYINGYKVTKELSNDHSGFSKWGFVSQRNQEYFIKEFLSPVWPDDNSPISPEQREKKIRECEAFQRSKARVYNAINKASNGNIVVPVDFFRFNSHYYLLTDKVDTASISVRDISRLKTDNLMMILKVFVHSLVCLENEGIVHSDLKPDNLLIKETLPNIYTVKLIDFDSSYLEDDVPSSDDIQCDLTYMAPEVFLHMIGEKSKVGTKSDIFSAGIIFHRYLSNELPAFPEDYDYVYEALLDGAEVKISESIPERLREIISKMLTLDYEERISGRDLYKMLVDDTVSVSDTTSKPIEVPSVKPEEKVNKTKPLYGFHAATDDDW